jgi:hypothetical protein
MVDGHCLKKDGGTDFLFIVYYLLITGEISYTDSTHTITIRFYLLTM